VVGRSGTQVLELCEILGMIRSVMSLGAPVIKDAGFLRPLRAVSLAALLAGAAGSVSMLLRAGQPPLFLRVLFSIWVASPFIVLLLVDMYSRRWSVIVRATLLSLMLVLSLCSLIIYGYAIFGGLRLNPVSVFVVVPPISWVLIGLVVSASAIISRRFSRT